MVYIIAASGISNMVGGISAIIIAFASMLGIAAIVADEKRRKQQ